MDEYQITKDGLRHPGERVEVLKNLTKELCLKRIKEPG